MKQRPDRMTFPQLTARTHATQLRLVVQQTCCGIGVPTAWMPLYYGFAMELDKLHRSEVSGETMRHEALRLIGKWSEKGLKPEVLRAIVATNFNITLGDGT